MAEKRRLGIVQALDWAFGRECAELDLPSLAVPLTGRGWSKVSTEYVLMQRAKLGGVRVDSSRGRSMPHDDAQDLAWWVGEVLPPEDAVTVTEYARAGMIPDCMPGARAALVPRTWNTKSRHGAFGKTEILATFTETILVPHPKNPAKKIARKKLHQIEWVPCTWDPHPQELASARDAYQRWWVCLEAVKKTAQARGLRSIDVTDQMPEFQPWR